MNQVASDDLRPRVRPVIGGRPARIRGHRGHRSSDHARDSDNKIGSSAVSTELEHAPKILVLSVADDVRSVLAIFEAGANGFLGKHESFAVVADAAIAVMAGDAPISASAFARLLPHLIGNGSSDVLTGRESRVLELVADGRSNDDIAGELGISVNTVRNHVSNVLRKLEVDNRGQAVIEARRRGAISGGS